MKRVKCTVKEVRLCVHVCVCVAESVRCRAAVAVLCVDRRPAEVSHRNTRNLDWWEHRENTVLHFYFLQMKLVKH